MPLRTETSGKLRSAYPRHIILFEFRVKPWSHVIPRTYVRAMLLSLVRIMSVLSARVAYGPNNQLLAGGACAPAFVAR